MIRGKRNDAYGRQTLRVDCCGCESYREAVSYIIRRIWNFGKLVIVSEQDRRDLPNIPLHGPPVKDWGGLTPTKPKGEFYDLCASR